jgi:hypothetical protein
LLFPLASLGDSKPESILYTYMRTAMSRGNIKMIR